MSRDWLTGQRRVTDDPTIRRLAGLLTPLDEVVEVPRIPDDHSFAPMFPDGLTPAAVLVPLVLRDGWQVLLTQRNELLSNHGGQISFPGGRRDEGDADYIHTALRETHEEVGIPPERVELIGFLDPHPVITGFGVVPVVGHFPADQRLTLDSREVAHAFEVPLDFVLDLGNYQRESITVHGHERYYYVMQYAQWRIWGATAGMLRNLAHRWDDG